MNCLLPNFLCIGAQKSGTTTLHKALSHHPDIFIAPEKELHYFTNNYYRGVEWYKNKFSTAEIQQSRGEITPYYLFHKEAPKRIKTLIPNVKLIALLRDPVERAVSQYYHSLNLGFENLSIEKAFQIESSRIASGSEFSHQKHSYLSRSKYIEQIDRYESLFQKEQILVIKSENLFDDQEKTLNKIFKFIGVDPNKKDCKENVISEYRGRKDNISDELKNILELELRFTNKEIRSKYMFGWDW